MTSNILQVHPGIHKVMVSWRVMYWQWGCCLRKQNLRKGIHI